MTTAPDPGATPPAPAAVRTRVVLVDDHQLFRAGVRAELAQSCDVVGEAATPAEAAAVIARTEPDVVLLDVHLPEGGGLAVLEALREAPREREVLHHLARGYAYKRIAARLEISPRTVEAHVSSVLRKLQLSSRHELSHWAATRGLLETGDDA